MTRLKRLLLDLGFRERAASPGLAPNDSCWRFVASKDGVDIYVAPRISGFIGCHRSTVLLVCFGEAGERKTLLFNTPIELSNAAVHSHTLSCERERKMIYCLSLLAFAAIQFRLHDLAGLME